MRTKDGAEPGFYTPDDYYRVAKHDVHVHVFTRDAYFLDHSAKENFSNLTINVDVKGFPSIGEQQEIAAHLTGNHAGIAFCSTFGVEGWDDAGWADRTIEYIRQSISRGAIAVKVWKNFGMELKDASGEFVMIDDPRLDAVFDFIAQNDLTLIGHIGEPKNCWLPVDRMTVKGDRDYFSAHPEYHMYLHPEFPSHERIMAARDHMLKKHPRLRFVGAHLASLEWDVAELARRLDAYPNMVVDTAERISHLQLQAIADWQKVRDFCMKYQDRILYGTDIIAETKSDPVQVRANATHRRKMHWQFFTQAGEMSAPKVSGVFRGLHLPADVVDKIYRLNAEKWFPGLKNKNGIFAS